jgi:hypothetical protein
LSSQRSIAFRSPRKSQHLPLPPTPSCPCYLPPPPPHGAMGRAAFLCPLNQASTPTAFSSNVTEIVTRLLHQARAWVTSALRCCSSRAPQVPAALPVFVPHVMAETHFAAAATASSPAPTAAADAKLLRGSNRSVQTQITHKVVSDGRGRHSARANSSPWVLNADSLLKNGKLG